MLACKFHLFFIFTYLYHVILIIIAIYCQSITNLAAVSMVSVKAYTSFIKAKCLYEVIFFLYSI